MITTGEEGVYIDIHVQPKARRPGVRGVHGDRLKLAVAEPANDGRANRAVVAVVADLLKVRRSAITLVAGMTSRRKRVFVEGMGTEDVRQLITSAVGDSGSN